MLGYQVERCANPKTVVGLGSFHGLPVYLVQALVRVLQLFDKDIAGFGALRMCD